MKLNRKNIVTVLHILAAAVLVGIIIDGLMYPDEPQTAIP